MDATCTIQDSIHVFNLVHKYVSRILGTYQSVLLGKLYVKTKKSPTIYALKQLPVGEFFVI